MTAKVIFLVLWAIGVIVVYRRSCGIIDKFKEEHTDVAPIVYDIVGIGICLAWPLLIPGTIKKFVRVLKERKSK